MASESRIVIVGGSSGIGLEVAKRLYLSEHKLLIASRSEKNLAIAKLAIGENVEIKCLDASNENSVIQFFKEIGEFNHLIITIKPELPHSSFLESNTSHAHSAYESKFWGQYYLVRHGAKYLKSGASITLTSGIASQCGYPGFSVVAAMNGAIESLAKSLAVELAPIRVNAVCPGFASNKPFDTSRENTVRNLAPKLPLQRLAQPEEIAEAYAYLLNCSYATGSIIIVDGGATCS